MKNKALECPRVTFMVEAIEGLGCKVPERFVACTHLDGTKAGGFQFEPGKDPVIYLGAGVGYGQRQVEQTLTHELVHAFDQCRAKARFDNLLHHACTEIRASALSGECDWSEEVNRGNFSTNGQGEKCVRRRAELSVAMNPYCASKPNPKEAAAEAVSAAFQRCYFDTAPFWRMP
jgi:inner membrane protease ATP23